MDEKIIIEIGGTYVDGNNIIWDEPDFSNAPTQIMEGTVTLTNGKEQVRRFTRDGRYWNSGAPKSDDPRNLVKRLDDTEPVKEDEEQIGPFETVMGVVDDFLPNPLKSASMRSYEEAEKLYQSSLNNFPHARYDQLVEETFKKIIELGKLKGGEYAGDTDRLANFRRNGEALQLPMETILRVYAGKHWDAISQYILDIQSGKTRTRSESISGRADDLIVYLLLFKAMVEERGL